MLDPEWSEADRLELATALRDLRRAAGLSGQALGARVYMSQTKISRIETGRIVPSVTDVELLVYALDVDAERSGELVSLARVANTEFRPGKLRVRAETRLLTVEKIAGSARHVRLVRNPMPDPNSMPTIWEFFGEHAEQLSALVQHYTTEIQ